MVQARIEMACVNSRVIFTTHSRVMFTSHDRVHVYHQNEKLYLICKLFASVQSLLSTRHLAVTISGNRNGMGMVSETI